MTWGLQHHVYVADNRLVSGLMDRGQIQLFLNVAFHITISSYPLSTFFPNKWKRKKTVTTIGISGYRQDAYFCGEMAH